MSSLSCSPTKQRYSFPRSSRFRPATCRYCTPSSATSNSPLRSTLNSMTYSIGRAHRSDFTQLPTRTGYVGENPSPTAYKVSSSFESKNMKWKTLADRRLLANTTKTVSTVPGPAAYDVVESDFGRHGQKYSLRVKTSPWKRDEVPGPGAYSPGGELHGLGVYMISKHAGSKAPKIGSFAKKVELRPTETDSPGPGAYEAKPNLSRTGVYFLQGYENSRCRTFSKASRRLVTQSFSGTSIGRHARTRSLQLLL